MNKPRAELIKRNKDKYCELLKAVCQTGDCVVCDLWMEDCCKELTK